MKKKAAASGENGKEDGQVLRAKQIGKALAAYLDGRDREAWWFAYRLCRDGVEADELLQEACYRVLRERRRYDSGRPMRGWLCAILRNAFVSSLRSPRRRDSLSFDYGDEMDGAFLHEALAERGPGPLDHLVRREQAATVRSAFVRLERHHRDVLTLCDAQGMSYAAAAKALRINMGTLRSRLHRARAKLRRLVPECDPG